MRIIWQVFMVLVTAGGVGGQHAGSDRETVTGKSDIRLEAMDGRGDRLVTDVQINGRPARLAIDTGASGTQMLFSSSLQRLGLTVAESPPPRSAVAPGNTAFGVTEKTTFTLLGQPLTGVPFAFVEVPASVPITGDVDGFLGWPAIRGNRWFFRLNAAPPTLDPIGNYTLESNDWKRLSVGREDILMLRPQPGNSAEFVFLIDTGNPEGVLLPPKPWQAWNAAHPRAAKSVMASFMFGQQVVASEVAWADEIEVGGIRLRDVPVQAAPEVYRHQAGTENFVVLGLAALKRAELIVDDRLQTAYLRAVRTPPVAYLHNHTGVVFIPRDENSSALVAHVVAGGPAARAGLRAGDELLNVNGWDVSGWRDDLDTLTEKLRMSLPPGTKWSFTVRRSSGPVAIELVAEHLLGPRPYPPR